MAPAPAVRVLAAASGSRSEPRPVVVLQHDWVVPPRPKPGRKPKEEDTESSKKAQNRASARAFRERQQGYVDHLEGRIRLLEQTHSGEVAHLQDQLRSLVQQNRALSDAVDELRAGRVLQAVGNHAKREGAGNLTLASKRRCSEVEVLSIPAPPYDARAVPLPFCGHCEPDNSCFCREIGYDVTPAPVLSTSAIPLRLRRDKADVSVKTTDVWKINTAPSTSTPLLCNGNPTNCPACSDDPFGKAFCESLSTSVCSTNPCDNCPNSIARSLIPAVDSAKPDDVTDALTFFNNLPCCGDSRLCGSSNCGAPTNPFEDQLGDVLLPRSVPPGLRTRETDIPCNDAWTMLKEHPNIAFANLQLLADVVAKRTRCDGGSDTDVATERRKRLTVERAGVTDALKFLDRASTR